METPEGVLLVDKSEGRTSYDVVDLIKRRLGVKKVGHGGTLDPFATGLLVVLVGRRCTRRQADFMKGEKEYLATIYFGRQTDTGDPTGRVVREYEGPFPGVGTVEDVLKGFVGEVMQRPHPYSAVKYRGRPLYYYTRRGIEVPVDPRPVKIYEIEVVRYQAPRLVVRLRVSGGFYVRSFAQDLGEALGIPAMTEALRRLGVGAYGVEDAVDFEQIEAMDAGALVELLRREDCF